MEVESMKCLNCDIEFESKSTDKNVKCSKCNAENLNPTWIKNNKISLYRLWQYDSNDRSEIARVISENFKTVQEWAMEHFIKEEFRQDVECTEIGIEWSKCGDCTAHLDLTDETKEEICESCEDSTEGIQIEEIETIEDEDLSFKTIYGTNEFFDLTTKDHKKAENWNNTLDKAFKINPQVGCDMLLGLTKIAQNEGQDLEKSKTVRMIDGKT